MHSNGDLKNIFLENLICTVFKRNRNLKETSSQSLHTKNKKEKNLVIETCAKSDIFKNHMISDNIVTCKVSHEKYYINNYDCNCMNVIYLISCTNCNEQYEGSPVDFKKRFRMRKSGINTKKDRLGVPHHCTNNCRDPQNLLKNPTNCIGYCKRGEQA